MHWLHVSSRILKVWTNHGFALAPSRIPGDPDLGGVWTGCITRRSDGAYLALYTAIPTHEPFTQVTCAALSSDLHTWEKLPGIVTGLPHKPEGYGDCFRDPQTLFIGNRCYCIIGSERLNKEGGAAFLYEATDNTLLSWRYVRVLYEGGAATGFDFECPDFSASPVRISGASYYAGKSCVGASGERFWSGVGIGTRAAKRTALAGRCRIRIGYR